MDWLEITVHSVAAALFLAGLALSILPALPGNFIVWAGVVVHKLWLGDASVDWAIVVVTGGLTLAGQLADIVLGYWGARKFGASWRGAVGAILGAFIGLFLPPPLLWLILGPIAGAIGGELLAGRTMKDGSRAGLGTLLGSALAFALKFALSVGVIAIFCASLLLR